MCGVALEPREGDRTVAHIHRVPYMVIQGLHVLPYFSERGTRHGRRNQAQSQADLT